MKATDQAEAHQVDPKLAVELVMHEVHARLLYVSAIEDLTPRMRRFTFSGEDLEQNFPFLPEAVADHVKLVFPDPETAELRMPEVRPDGMRTDPNKPRPIFRDYTVRSFRPGALTIDFVLHDHGVAGNWAINARLGDVLGVLGPRGSHRYPAGYSHYLIAGDETALPAIARWLEFLPAEVPVATFVSVHDAEDEIPLARTASWLHRCVSSATDSIGLTGGLSLEEAIRAWAASADSADSVLPPQSAFVWLAGEAGTLKPIRRYLRQELGLSKVQTDIDGYWKQGVQGLDHHEADEDD